MATLIGHKRREPPTAELEVPIKRSRVEEETGTLTGTSNMNLPTSRYTLISLAGLFVSEETDSVVSSAFEDHDASEVNTTPSTQASTPIANFPCRDKKLVCDFPGCHKTYNRPVRLAEHQRSHTNERPFVCGRDSCDKAFLRDSHLKAHAKSHHEDQRDWICDWLDCGQAFATGQRMRNHRKRHEEKEQLKCTGYPPCEQYFRKPETLQRHIATAHLNDKAYVCDHLHEETGQVCGRKFNQINTLNQHTDREHGGNRFWCNICSPDVGDSEVVNTGDGAIQYNAVGFATYGQLQDHMKKQHPPTCIQCGHVCESQAQLRAHVDIQHGNLEERRNFICDWPDCGRGFTSKGNMMVHKRSVHEQQKFVCGQVDLQSSKTVPAWDGRGACGHGFSTKATLERHVRAQHLHLPDLPRGKEKRRQRKERMELASGDAPDLDMAPTDSIGSRLTGARYEEERFLGCTVVPCPQRRVGL